MSNCMLLFIMPTEDCHCTKRRINPFKGFIISVFMFLKFAQQRNTLPFDPALLMDIQDWTQLLNVFETELCTTFSCTILKKLLQLHLTKLTNFIQQH